MTTLVKTYNYVIIENSNIDNEESFKIHNINVVYKCIHDNYTLANNLVNKLHEKYKIDILINYYN